MSEPADIDEVCDECGRTNRHHCDSCSCSIADDKLAIRLLNDELGLLKKDYDTLEVLSVTASKLIDDMASELENGHRFYGHPLRHIDPLLERVDQYHKQEERRTA